MGFSTEKVNLFYKPKPNIIQFLNKFLIKVSNFQYSEENRGNQPHKDSKREILLEKRRETIEFIDRVWMKLQGYRERRKGYDP